MPFNMTVDYLRHRLQRNGVKAVVTQVDRGEIDKLERAQEQEPAYRAAASTGDRNGR